MRTVFMLSLVLLVTLVVAAPTGREEGDGSQSQNSINIPEAQAHLQWIMDMVVQQLVTLLQAQANADNGGSVSGNSENHNTGDSNSGAGSGGGVGGQGIQLPHQLQQLLLNQVTAVVDAPAGGQTSGGSGGSPAVPVTGGSAAGLAQSLFSAFNGHQGGQQALPQQSETH